MGRLARSLFAILALVFLCLENRGFAAPAPISGFANSPSLYASQAGPKQWMPLTAYYTGQGKLSYRWYRDGRLLKGFKGKELRVGTTSLAQEGVYTVDITDSADGVTVRKAFFVKLAAPKGYLIGLGDNSHGQADIPASLLPPMVIHAFAAGGAHSLAVSDGRIHAWGDDSSGQSTVPSLGNKRGYTVAAGAKHSLALLEDGTVRAWGDNSAGQCDVPASLGVVRAIAAGGGHSLAIRLDDTVVGWGENSSGQLTVPEFSSVPVAIAAGHDHSLALLANGEVVAWGANDYGQSEVPPKLKNIVSIGAAGDASFAITRAGRVHVWGDTLFKQSPAPAKLKPVASAAGGWDFIAARLGTGRLSFWGDGAESLVAQSNGLARIYALAAGGGHVLALRNGTTDAKPRITAPPASVSSTTWDSPVELSVTAKGPMLAYQWYRAGQPIPGATGATYRIDAMRLGDVGTYSVRVFNGANYVDHTGISVARPGMPPLQADLLTPRRQVVPVGGRLRIEAAGQGAGDVTYSWSRNGENLPGQDSSVLDIPIDDDSAGGTYVVRVKDQGQQNTSRPTFVVVPPSNPTRIVTWGDNSHGQTRVPDGLDNVIKLVAGSTHTLALRADGTVVAWGDNRYGQCSVPDALTEVVDIAAGKFYSAALKADGSITVWGGGRPTFTQATTDPQISSILVSSYGVHTYTHFTRQNTLAELPNNGGLIRYAVGGDGAVSGSVTSSDLDFASAAAGSSNPASKSRSVSGSSSTVIIGGGLDTVISPWGNQRGFVYSNYGTDVVAFSHYHGRSATILADKTARFWETGEYYDTDYWGRRSYYWASSGINSGGVIDNVSAILAGGSFFAWQRGDGTIGGFGNHVTFHNAPYQLTGLKTWCAGSDHAVALLTVDAPATPQVLEFTPSRAVGAGESVRLKVRATGEHLRYQWLFNGEPIAGADTASWLIVGFDASKAGAYRVRISDGFTTVTSDACNLSLGTAPVLTEAPAKRLGLRAGERLELSASLADASGCSFEWRRNGVVLEGETSSSLIRETAALDDAGRYTLRVTGADGATTLVTSHVFVMPVVGTRIFHEWDFQYPFSEPKPWRSIDDAVDFIPSGMALRLDGRVAGWRNSSPYTLDSETAAWLATLGDIVAIADWGLLQSNGRLAIPPSNFMKIPAEARDLTNVVALTSSPPALVLDDGRVGVFESGSVNGSSVPVIRWLPSVGDLVDIQTPRVFVTPERSTEFGYSPEPTVIAAGEDGTVSISASGGLVSFPELSGARAIRPDREGGVSVVDAEGVVHAASIFGRARPDDQTLTELRQTEAGHEGRAELLAGGKVRAWKHVWSKNTWSKTELPGYPAWLRDNLRVRLDDGRVMILRSADSLVDVSITPSRNVFAPDQTIVLEAEVSGSGELELVWERNGAILRGATSRRLELPAGDPRNHGWYRLRVTDADGNSDEAVAYVMVGQPDASNVIRSGAGIDILADGSVKMWNTSTGESYGIVPDSVRNVVAVTRPDYSPYIALDASGRLTQWNAVTGEIIRQTDGVLWIREGDRRPGFAVMRNGTVRLLKDGSLLFGDQPWHREVVDIKSSQVARSDWQAITRRDGSVAVAGKFSLFGETTVRFLSRTELGGTVVGSRVTFFEGAEFFVETSEGVFQIVNVWGTKKPATLADFSAFR